MEFTQQNNKKIKELRIKDLNEKLGLKNVLSHVNKEIKGNFKDSPTKEQIKKYKKNGYELNKNLCFI